MIEITQADAADLDAILRLLSGNGLPVEGLAEHLEATVVAREDGVVAGAAALEIYADGALLRSVVVRPSLQGTGVGRALVDRAIAIARARQVTALYLLTTTASGYFPKLGFVEVTRADVPPGVQQSIEFTSACPASATVMRRTLNPT